MSKNLEAKKVVVSEIEEKIEKAESIVIVEYKALTVEAITALRAKCRAANVDYCVLKNTLVRRALEESGLRPWPRMELELFSGEGGVLILARPAPEFSVSLADYALPFLLR